MLHYYTVITVTWHYFTVIVHDLCNHNITKSAVKRQGNFGEFHHAWRVVALIAV